MKTVEEENFIDNVNARFDRNELDFVKLCSQTGCPQGKACRLTCNDSVGGKIRFVRAYRNHKTAVKALLLCKWNSSTPFLGTKRPQKGSRALLSSKWNASTHFLDTVIPRHGAKALLLSNRSSSIQFNIVPVRGGDRTQKVWESVPRGREVFHFDLFTVSVCACLCVDDKPLEAKSKNGI